MKRVCFGKEKVYDEWGGGKTVPKKGLSGRQKAMRRGKVSMPAKRS